MKSFARTLLSLFAVSVTLAAAPAFANGVVNGGFETGNFSGWTSVDPSTFTGVYAAGNGYTPQNGLYFAGLGALNTGTLSQTITDTAGLSTLSFYIADQDGFTPSSFSAAVNGVTLLTLSNFITSAYTHEILQFTATGTDTIRFTDSDPNGYLSLDNVSVSANASPTPEPSSLLLLGTGVLGLAGAVRRKFSAVA